MTVGELHLDPLRQIVCANVQRKGITVILRV